MLDETDDISDEDLAVLFMKIDVNGSGGIDWNEFTGFLLQVLCFPSQVLIVQFTHAPLSKTLVFEAIEIWQLLCCRYFCTQASRVSREFTKGNIVIDYCCDCLVWIASYLVGVHPTTVITPVHTLCSATFLAK